MYQKQQIGGQSCPMLDQVDLMLLRHLLSNGRFVYTILILLNALSRLLPCTLILCRRKAINGEFQLTRIVFCVNEKMAKRK